MFKVNPGDEIVVGGRIELVTDKNVTINSSGGIFSGAVAKPMAVSAGYPLNISGELQQVIALKLLVMVMVKETIVMP